MSILIISTSLSSASKSRRLAEFCRRAVAEAGGSAELVDLRLAPLPLCDGESVWDSPSVRELQDKVRTAKGLIITAPIYNWSVAASTKNLIECLGDVLQQKTIGLACAAGGPRGLLAPMAFVNSLVLDFQAFIVPKIVVSGADGFTEQGLTAETERRLLELVRMTNWMADALVPHGEGRGAGVNSKGAGSEVQR